MIELFGLNLNTGGWITLVAEIINVIIVIFIIFMERKNPSATLAWVLILFFAPIVGFVLYLFLSQNIARSKIFKINDGILNYYNDNLAEQKETVARGKYKYATKSAKTWSDMIKLNQTYGESLLTQDNDIKIYDDGKRMYATLLTDIKLAKENINVQYFIIKDDPVGNRLLDLLTEKAREGVKVRLLMDAMGSVAIRNWKLKEFVAEGGENGLFGKTKNRNIIT